MATIEDLNEAAAFAREIDELEVEGTQATLLQEFQQKPYKIFCLVNAHPLAPEYSTMTFSQCK